MSEVTKDELIKMLLEQAETQQKQIEALQLKLNELELSKSNNRKVSLSRNQQISLSQLEMAINKPREAYYDSQVDKNQELLDKAVDSLFEYCRKFEPKFRGNK